MKGGSARRRAGVAGIIAAAAAAATAAGQAAGPAPEDGPDAVPSPWTVDGPPDAFPQRRPSLNLFGVTGLIDTPTAEVQPDGQLSFTSAWVGGQLRNTITFQALPWLSGSFRYSVLPDFNAAGAELYDRSFDVKVQVWPETDARPALALGLQDFLGTGVYSGEYIVATKTVLPELTVSGGVGWGRFASAGGVDNPLRIISDRAAEREGVDNQFGNTGRVRFNRFFRGEDMGFFGGLEWRTPVEGLTLKAEYSSDDYARDWRFASRDAQIPVNFGLEYAPWDGVEIGAYAVQGEVFGLRASFSLNPLAPLAFQDAKAGPPPITPRARAATPPPGLAERFGPVRELIDEAPATSGPAAEARITLERVTDGPRWAEAAAPADALETGACPLDAARRIDAELGVIDGVTFRRPDGSPFCTVVLRPAGRAHIEAEAAPLQGWDTGWFADPARREAAKAAALASLRNEALEVVAFELAPQAVRLEIENPRYHAAAQAIGRAAAALTAPLPPSVERFEITLLSGDLPATTVRLRRAELERNFGAPDAARASWLGVSVSDADPAARPAPLPGTYPRYSWGLNPDIPVGLFDPDAPVRADLRLVLTGKVEPAPGLSLSGAVQQRLVGNLDDIDRESDSTLPHVRSDTAFYNDDLIPDIARLTADYVFKLSPSVYARASAGMFETMFGGVGGEVLWKPADQSWGLGAELNYVVQRDFDGFFGFQDYDVVTGHGSFYWETGWHGMEVQVDAGRYLAGDYGATFSLTRKFSNGWEIGGFFTLTDVPFDEFGEGSFDKGIRVKIPFNWGLPYETQSTYTTTLKPLTRDGGQRLNVANRLYDSVDDVDARALREDWSLFWK